MTADTVLEQYKVSPELLCCGPNPLQHQSHRMLCMCAQPSNYFELFVKGRAARLVVPIPAARISDGGAELQCRVP